MLIDVADMPLVQCTTFKGIVVWFWFMYKHENIVYLKAFLFQNIRHKCASTLH